MNALDVARAALMEVGADPELVWAVPGALVSDTDDEVVRRALMLGALAEFGPDFLVWCRDCSPNWTHAQPCTPVRDALRGVRCGR